MTAAKRIYKITDLTEMKLDESAQIIHGDIVYKTMSGGKHASKARSVLTLLSQNFHRKKSAEGKGGWWILPEVTVAFPKAECALKPDISGWRRETCVVEPTEYPVLANPNWVCEICHTTLKKDTVTVPEILALHKVEYYWIIYVETENLQVFKLNGMHYSLIGSFFRENKLEKIPPFENYEINVGVLLGDESED